MERIAAIYGVTFKSEKLVIRSMTQPEQVKVQILSSEHFEVLQYNLFYGQITSIQKLNRLHTLSLCETECNHIGSLLTLQHDIWILILVLVFGTGSDL